MDFPTLLTGIAIGAGFGFILHRGRFSLNTAFRDILYIKNYTVFRAYLLALIVTTIGANLLEQFHVISLDQNRQEFAWLANAAGGYLFGVGMVFAGGGSEGTLYQAGEGLVGSWMAAAGFMIGTAATRSGALSGFYGHLRSITLSPGSSVTLYGMLGINRWVAISALSVPALIFVFGGPKQYDQSHTGFTWRATGILAGAMIVLSWYLSKAMSGAAFGISFTDPSEDLLLSVVSGGRWNWNVALFAGVPLGAYLSARSLNEFSWRSPRANVLVQQFLGGLAMGIGGMLAGGCTIGHCLTGLSTLAAASLVTTVFVVLGSWTMVYLLFMRGPGRSPR